MDECVIKSTKFMFIFAVSLYVLRIVFFFISPNTESVEYNRPRIQIYNPRAPWLMHFR